MTASTPSGMFTLLPWAQHAFHDVKNDQSVRAKLQDSLGSGERARTQPDCLVARPMSINVQVLILARRIPGHRMTVLRFPS